MIRTFLIVALAGVFLQAHAREATRIHERDQTGPEFVIAEDGKSLCPIFIGDKSGEPAAAAARRLADILAKMTGATFEIRADDGTGRGILFGVPSDFSSLEHELGFDTTDPGQMQGYVIEAKEDSLHVLAATPLALDYVATALLYELGYRIYAPTPRWTILPAVSKAVFKGRIKEAPDFYFRRIWPNSGTWGQAHSDAFVEWQKGNRDYGFAVDASHIYQDIPPKYPDEFAKHPEYWALCGGKREPSGEPKFCLSNPSLRSLISRDAVAVFRQNPSRAALSREPSDGGGWCECEACQAVGTPSDLAVLLANESAQAVRDAGITGKKIGLLAYNYHSPPPRIEVDDDVVVQIANGFIKGGFTFDELVAGWSAKAAELGVYEYFSIYIWSFDLPGQAHASQVEWLVDRLPKLYGYNIRHFVAEASDNWAVAGLGHFLSEQILWNVDNAARAGDLERQYIVDCFGNAADVMTEFYHLINHTKPVLAEHLLAKMYRLLAAARDAAGDDPAVLGRLADLGAYTLYCEHFLRQRQTPSLENKLALRRYASGIVDRRMVHTLALRYRATEMGVPKEQDIDWDNRSEIDDATIWAAVEKGVAELKPLTFEPRSFSDELVPVKRFARGRVNGTFLHDDFNLHRFYMYVKPERKLLTFNVTGGLVPHYRDRGNVEMKLVQIGGASAAGAKETVVATDTSVPPDGVMRKVRMRAPESGLYRLDMTNKGDISRLTWDSSQGFTLHTSLDDSNLVLNGNNQSFFFYVPRDADVLGMYVNSSTGKIMTMNDEVVAEFSAETKGKFIGVNIPEAKRGQLYKLVGVYGNFVLLTVPPYLSPSPNGLLLPKEVVEAELLR